MLRTRQEALASASTWSGTRVAEETAGADETALEFTLPGDQLDVALAALSDLDARVVATQIDVDAEQIDRFAPSATTGPDDAADPDPDPAEAEDVAPVRLRVEVTEAAAPGAGVLGQIVLWVFAAIGVVASWRAVADRWAERRGRGTGSGTRRRDRAIDRVDLRDDPPTQETPRVTPPW